MGIINNVFINNEGVPKKGTSSCFCTMNFTYNNQNSFFSSTEFLHKKSQKGVYLYRQKTEKGVNL